MTSLLFIDLPEFRNGMLPLTRLRTGAQIRCGIFTMEEKWRHFFQDASVSYATEEYLQAKYPLVKPEEGTLFINPYVIPEQEMAAAILALPNQHLLLDANGLWIAARGNEATLQAIITGLRPIHYYTYAAKVRVLHHTWDIVEQNSTEIANDLQTLNSNDFGGTNDPYTRVYNPEAVWIHPTAKVKAAVINAEEGPVYIGPGVEIQEGSLLRGPVAICVGTVVHMGAKIRPGTTIGPWCKVGGEVSNSVMFAYSNKGHDGFLGHAVIAEWVNMGAGTEASNLKNDYGVVKMWSEAKNDMISTGRLFAGPVIGDFTKTGINTMLNTGTVAGVCANIYGGGFAPKYVPSFTWGGAEGLEIYRFDKAIEAARRMMDRRKVTLTDADVAILKHVFDSLPTVDLDL